MEIIKFKELVNNNKVSDDIYILRYIDNMFLIKQYLDKISKDKSLDLSFVDVLSIQDNNIFSFSKDFITVNIIDKFSDHRGVYLNNKNTFIICNEIDKETREIYKNNIVDFPKLENWQITAYTEKRLDGIDKQYIDWLCKIYNYDIYSIDNEINKMAIFSNKSRLGLFKELNDSDNFKGVNSLTIFDILNAFLTKNKKVLIDYLNESPNKFNVFALHTMLLKQFNYIISIQLNNRTTADDLGISFQQYKVLKNMCGYYSNNKLIDIYKFLLEIMEKIKSGYISQDYLLDYMICNILN